MILRRKHFVLLLALIVSTVFAPAVASAITVSGVTQPDLPSGQFMSLKMTIDDVKTKFELTGPEFSWFAFGFDTTSMFGYSLIIQGTGGTRTVTEQNLSGSGDPGVPQTMQNASIVNTTQDALNHLTTVFIERVNNTGDANDPIFSPDMTGLDIIAAYDSFAKVATPNGTLSFHGSRGRGTGFIEFAVVPEPSAILLAAASGFVIMFNRGPRRGSR